MTEPQAAVVLVHAREPADSLLLIRRAVRAGDPWSGHWSFPGGRRDPEDTDLLATALRELAEECGLGLGPEHLETALEPALAGRAGGRPMLVAPFVLRVPGELPVALQEDEAAEGLWIPLRQLRDLTRHCLRPVPGRPPEFRYPSIALNVAPLWGFTYRMITHWLGLLADDSPTERAGFRVACSLVAFLLGAGLELREEWCDRKIELAGVIPVEAVAERFCLPGAHVQAVNSLELRADRIRLLGLAHEEYIITAIPPGA